MKFRKRVNESNSYGEAFWEFYDKYGEKGIYKECDKFIKKWAKTIFFEEYGTEEPPESFYEMFFRTAYIKDVQRILDSKLEFIDLNYDQIGDLIKEIDDFGLSVSIDVSM